MKWCFAAAAGLAMAATPVLADKPAVTIGLVGVGQMTIDVNDTVARFTIVGSPNQWIGFAISPNMLNGDPHWICASEGGTWKLKRALPSKNSGAFTGNIAAASEITDDGQGCSATSQGVTMKFNRPLAVDDGLNRLPLITTGGSTLYVYATADNAEFGYHTIKGSGTFDLATGKATSETETFSTAITAHAALMGISWVLLVPLGIIAARYFKKQNPMWFHVHRVLLLLAIVMTAVGAVLGFIGSGTCTSTHRPLGIVIISVVLLQPFLGFVRPNKESDKRRMWYYAHALFGLILLMLTVAQVALGLILLDNSVAIYLVAVTYGVLTLFAILCELGLHNIISLPWVESAGGKE